MAPITIIPKACSCCKEERSSRDKSSNLPLPNILYEGSEGKDCPAGNDYEVSVTGIAFCYINRAEHSAELATCVATPYPAAPDSPLFRGENRTSLHFPSESCGTMLSTHRGTVHILPRMCKSGEVRRLACP